ncbi:P-loop containing nucleoside triphosphate hydrolase protein [Pelagophyceae sp. CCMP2097]|nr:P-loop containing nucleoside triphosphate hydrolase protein [Pelagophyceae sp. CCMP2097]
MASDVAYGAGQPKLDKFRLDFSLLEHPIVVPPEGRVLFEDKTAPVNGRPAAELSAHAEPFCFTRGLVDVSKIAAKLDAGGDAIWSETFAAENNVLVDRPSHDSWGIRKLIFVFSDDFVHRVYRLPLWDDSEWAALLQPVFDACGVSRHRVIRCLFASMPPRTVIPVHHDSGYWVPRTHRLHCAIKTDSSVIFRVGSSDAALQRFQLDAGRVVELNNQARHFVTNFWDDYRVHLIFDYVDDAAPAALLPPLLPDVTLPVGAEVLQTRRSIGLGSERGNGALAPHFLIIGAQKAGTTSMYEYVAQHPLVVRGRRRESHFLDWRWPKYAGDRGGAELRKQWHDDFFFADVHNDHASLLACDSTPSFLLASHVAVPRLLRMGMAPPMVVMLRDPVERAASHFAMIDDASATPAQQLSRGAAWRGKTVRAVALSELRGLIDCGALRRAIGARDPPALTDPFTWDQAAFEKSLEALPNANGSHSLLARGLYAAQLAPWLRAFEASQFLYVRCEDMATEEGARREIGRVFDHVGLRAPPAAGVGEHPVDDVRHFNKRPHAAVDETLRAELRAFFAPFNTTLYDQLAWGPDQHWD